MPSRDEIRRIFSDLPGDYGCATAETAALELRLGVEFPPSYRQIVASNGRRLGTTSFFVAPENLAGRRCDAHSLANDDYDGRFVLSSSHLVAARDEAFAFYFFECKGDDNTPVWECNYNANLMPTERWRSVPQLLAERIQAIYGL